MRDGRSFSTRRVIAVQHGETIFSLSASFQLDQDGHRPPAADARRAGARRRCRRWSNRYGDVARGGRVLPRRCRGRSTCATSTTRRGSSTRTARATGCSRVWMRADGTLPDDPLLHVCVLTFASDMTLLDSVLVRHGLAPGLDDHLDGLARPRDVVRAAVPRRRVAALRDAVAVGVRRPRPGHRPVLHRGRPAGVQRRAGGHDPASGAERVAEPAAPTPASTWRRSVSGEPIASRSAAAPVHDGVRQVQLAGRVDPLHQRERGVVAGAQPERHQRERVRRDELEALVGRDPARRTPAPARRGCGCARAAPRRRTSGSPPTASARGSAGRAGRASRGSRSPRRTRWRRCAGTRAGSTARRPARSRSATQNASQSKLVSSHLCGLVRRSRRCSRPSLSQRSSGATAATPAHAASTCSHAPASCAIAASSRDRVDRAGAGGADRGDDQRRA